MNVTKCYVVSICLSFEIDLLFYLFYLLGFPSGSVFNILVQELFFFNFSTPCI